MIKLKAIVQCPYCSKSQTINCFDYVVDKSSHERQMGPECEYTIECDAYECEECGKDFGLKGSIWEYPEGAENLNEVVAVSTQDEDED